MGKIGRKVAQGEVVGSTFGGGVSADPAQKRCIENSGRVKNKSRHHQFHLQGPPSDCRGLGGGIRNIEWRPEGYRRVDDDGNTPSHF